MASALARGHEVTVFNRGQSGPTPAGARAITGDRESAADLARLALAGPWDAVLDPSAQVPRTVLESARVLSEAERYVLVSSVSAYVGWPVEPLDEGSGVLPCPPDAGEDFGETDPRGWPTQYGFLKAGCERAAISVFGPRATVLRPGVILGPSEYVGRLPWWVRRIAAGGRVLAPGSPDQQIQPIDVRDVANFAVRAADSGIGGVFNVAAAPTAATFGSFLAACRAVTSSDAELIWVDDDVLIEHGVRQWTELPLWRTYPGTWRVSADKAVAAGLVCRPLEETVADTWRWLAEGGAAIAHERASELGIGPAKEAAILDAWDRTRR